MRLWFVDCGVVFRCICSCCRFVFCDCLLIPLLVTICGFDVNSVGMFVWLL